jgi:hypothetical protein
VCLHKQQALWDIAMSQLTRRFTAWSVRYHERLKLEAVLQSENMESSFIHSLTKLLNSNVWHRDQCWVCKDECDTKCSQYVGRENQVQWFTGDSMPHKYSSQYVQGCPLYHSVNGVCWVVQRLTCREVHEALASVSFNCQEPLGSRQSHCPGHTAG